MYKQQREELNQLISNMDALYKAYYKETKDMISRLIVVENNLTRLNHLLTMIRNQIAEQNGNRQKK